MASAPRTKKQGCDLDEFQAHRVLEKQGETLTVKEMRARLLKLDVDNNKRLALTEYLINKYMPEEEKVVDMVADANQGGVDPKLLRIAEEKMAAAQTELDEAADAAEKAHTAVVESKSAAKAAHETLEKSKQAAQGATAALKKQEKAEKEVTKAVEEATAAADALEAEEKKIADKLQKLQDKIDDPKAGSVKRNSAINRKAQLESEDPLPLRKAKISQNAALKKVKKEKKISKAATKECKEAETKAHQASAAAAEAKENADQKEQASVVAKKQADEAKEVAKVGFQEAQNAIEELKKQGTGLPQGKIWWMERTLQEKKKFMPK